MWSMPLEDRHWLHSQGKGACRDVHGHPEHHETLLDDCTDLLRNVHRTLALPESIPNRTAWDVEHFVRKYGSILCVQAKRRRAVETHGEEERLMPSRGCDVCYSWWRGKLTRQGRTHTNQFQWRDFFIPDDALRQVCEHAVSTWRASRGKWSDRAGRGQAKRNWRVAFGGNVCAEV